MCGYAGCCRCGRCGRVFSEPVVGRCIRCGMEFDEGLMKKDFCPNCGLMIPKAPGEKHTVKLS